MSIDGIKNSSSPTPQQKVPTRKPVKKTSTGSIQRKKYLYVGTGIVCILLITVVEIRINWTRIQAEAVTTSPSQTYQEAYRNFETQLGILTKKTQQALELLEEQEPTSSTTTAIIEESSTSTPPTVQGVQTHNRLPE